MADAKISTVYPPSPKTPTQTDFDTACKAGMEDSGQVRIKAATNIDPPVVMRTIAPSSPPEDSPPPEERMPPPIPMYQSIGVQTLPPKTAAIFIELNGRKPTHYEHEHNLGLAGLGRFKATGTNVHDYLRSAEIPIPERSPGLVQATSGFQTDGFQARQTAIAKAKAKASLMAAKYKKVAADEGFKIWGEVRDEKTIHTEQFRFNVKLDMHGNAHEGEDITGHFVPNIYRDELDVVPRRSDSAHPSAPVLIPSKTTCPVVPSQKFAPPRSQPVSHEQHYRPFQPIASIEPADREDQQEPTEPDGGREEDYYGWPEWYGNFIPDLLPAYRPDDDDSFVVFDPAEAIVPPSAPRSNKRKAHTEIIEVNEGHRPKRTYPSSPKGRAGTKDGWKQYDRGERPRSRSRARNRSLSTTYSRSPSPVPRSRRRSPVRREEKLYWADSWGDDRHNSRRRSRSPDEGLKDPKEVHRLRDTSRRRSKERDTGRHFSSRNDNQTEIRRHRNSSRALTPQRAINNSIESSRAPTTTPLPTNEVSDSNDVSQQCPRQSRLPKPTAPYHLATTGSVHRHLQPDNAIRREGPKQLTAQIQDKVGESSAVAIQQRINNIMSTGEAENHRRQASNVKKHENITIHDAQKHEAEKTKTPMSKKVSKLANDIVKEVKPLKNFIKQVEPPKRVEKEVVALNKFMKNAESAKKMISKIKLPGKDQQSVPVKKMDMCKAPKPKIDEREQDKVGAHQPQRGRKRSNDDVEATANGDVTPQKKAKKDDEQILTKITHDGAISNKLNEHEQEKTVVPPKKAVTRPKRAEMQRFVPRALRDAQSNSGSSTNNRGNGWRR